MSATHLPRPQIFLHFIIVALEALPLLRLKVNEWRAVCPHDCRVKKARVRRGERVRKYVRILARLQ